MYRFKTSSSAPNCRTASIFAAVVACLALTLAGCSTSDNTPVPYPTQLTDVAVTQHYPLEAAGFTRDAVTKYSPGTIDISAGYNLFSPTEQIASTLYVYQYPDSMDIVFEKEKNNITRLNNEAKLLDEAKIKIVKNGIEYDALQATYQYDTNFANKQQSVFSQFVLWKYKNKYLKLRSTSPLAQQDTTLAKNAELLDAVDWAH